jgi:DNA-binding NarL/FixJ family response regulator
MRAILVGSRVERARLRGGLGSSIEIVGEFSTMAAARRSSVDADMIVRAARRNHAGSPADTKSSGSTPIVDDREQAVAEPLTPREINVLELLAEGLPNKGIARRLGISDQTVKFHVGSISSKLGAANRTDAVRRAVRGGLITL